MVCYCVNSNCVRSRVGPGFTRGRADHVLTSDAGRRASSGLAMGSRIDSGQRLGFVPDWAPARSPLAPVLMTPHGLDEPVQVVTETHPLCFLGHRMRAITRTLVFAGM